jgi:hypothetical protein
LIVKTPLLTALFILSASHTAVAQTLPEPIQRCLMSVTATPSLKPREEAHRKVVCYEGTRGLVRECESSVTATMRLPSDIEQHYKAQCRLVSPN